MCLIASIKDTREFLAEPGKKVTVYKVLSLPHTYNYSTLRSPCCGNKKWQSGNHYARTWDGKLVGKTRYQESLDDESEYHFEINEAIHVFLTRTAAANFCLDNEVIVKATAQRKDCFGVNKRDGEAAFRNIFISKDSFRKALKEIQEKNRRVV